VEIRIKEVVVFLVEKGWWEGWLQHDKKCFLSYILDSTMIICLVCTYRSYIWVYMDLYSCIDLIYVYIDIHIKEVVVFLVEKGWWEGWLQHDDKDV
jgi:hypothetical protein